MVSADDRAESNNKVIPKPFVKSKPTPVMINIYITPITVRKLMLFDGM